MAVDPSKPTSGTFEDRAVWLIEKLLPDFPKLGPLGAFAICGNLGRESGIQQVQEGGKVPPSGGYGLAQWTGPRRTAYMTYCAKTGRDYRAMQSGYDYLFVELKGEYAHVIDEMAAASTLEAKTAVFEEHFEMAGIVAEPDRIAFAVRAQKAWEAHLAAAPSLGGAPLPSRPPAPPSSTPPPGIPPTPTTPPAPTQGTTVMFSIGSLISLISSAPSIIEGVMKLISEVEAGYAKGKAAGGDPIVIFEDILAALVANKGAVASAVLGPEPSVTPAGAIVAAPKVTVK